MGFQFRRDFNTFAHSFLISADTACFLKKSQQGKQHLNKIMYCEL